MNTIPGYPLPERRVEDMYPYMVFSEELVDVHETMSTVLEVFEAYYKDFFPKEYFRTTWKNTQQEFRTKLRAVRSIKDKPSMFINTSIDLDTESFQSLKHMPQYQIYDSGERTNFGAYTIPLLVYKDLTIAYNTNYYISSFEVLMAVDSYKEMLNLYNRVIHTMRKGRGTKFIIERPLYSKIPRIYVKYIARKNVMDPKSDTFLDALNNVSNHPIIRVDKPNGGYDFYVKLHTTLHVDSGDMPSKDDFTRDEEREGTHRVTDIVRFRYEIPTMYFLASSTGVPAIEASQLLTEFQDAQVIEPVDMEAPYFFAPVKEVYPIPNKYPGYTLSQEIKLAYESADEYLDLFEYFGPDNYFGKALKAVCPTQADANKVIKLDIYENGNLLDEGVSMTHVRPSIINTQSVYEIHLYVAMGPINDYLVELEKVD